MKPKTLLLALCLLALRSMAQETIDSSTVPDPKYPKGTRTTITRQRKMVAGGDTAVLRNHIVLYHDSLGRLRERHDSLLNAGNKARDIEQYLYDADGHLHSIIQMRVDAQGRYEFFKEFRYNGQDITYGHEEYGDGTQRNFNPATGKLEEGRGAGFVKMPDSSGTAAPERPVEKKVPPRVGMLPAGNIGAGPAFMHFGDKDTHYDSYGAAGSFTYDLAPQVGITADVGLYLHKKTWHLENQDFTQNLDQYSFTAGITYVPVLYSPVNIYLHGLAGVSIYSVKDATSGYGSQHSSTSSFTVNAGAGAQYFFGGPLGAGIEAAYTPTFFYHTTQNNYRLAAFVFYRLFKKKLKQAIENNLKDQAGTNPPVMLAMVTARHFVNDPVLTDPDTPTKKIATYVHTVADKCDSEDVFRYHNDARKPVVATLIVTSLCNCGVHVFAWELRKRGGQPPKEETGGDTKEKKRRRRPGTPPEEDARKMFNYDVEKLEGSDVYSFFISPGATVEMEIICAAGQAPCNFTRQFSVTEAERVEVKKGEQAPRLSLVDKTTAREQEKINRLGNHCISKDVVFYKIHNRNVEDVMRVHYKAVSECDCYYDAYPSNNNAVSDNVNDQYHTTNGEKANKVGVDDKNYGVPTGVATPAPANGSSEAKDEMEAILKPGETAYLKGRCPVQNQNGGPCKGKIMITGISYRNW